MLNRMLGRLICPDSRQEQTSVVTPHHSCFPPLSSSFLLSLVSSAFLLACVTPRATAQDLTHKAPPQTRPVLVTGATIHPVSAPEIADGVLYFNDGEIKGVHTAAEWAEIVKTALFAEPFHTIDGKGLHVYPGLISPWSQLGLTEIQAVRQTRDTSETGDVTPEVIAANAVNPDSTLVPVTRSNGVLLAGTFPAGGLISGRGSVIRLDGWTNRDMTVVEAAGLVLRWPTMRTFTAWWMDRSDSDQQKEIAAALVRVREVFDTAEAYHKAREAEAGTPIDLRWEAMRGLWSSEEPLRLFIHANDLDQINAAVAFCAERNLRCVIVGGRESDRCADLLKAHNVPVIISGGTFMLPRRADSDYDDAYTLPKRLKDAGVVFTLAGGDDTAHERNLPYAAALGVAHGLAHDDALRAITLDAAAILGVDDLYGSLEVGKSATILVTTGSPLEVTTHIRHAFIDGREIDLSNKQSKLYEKYRERYRQTGDLERP